MRNQTPKMLVFPGVGLQVEVKKQTLRRRCQLEQINVSGNALPVNLFLPCPDFRYPLLVPGWHAGARPRSCEIKEMPYAENHSIPVVRQPSRRSYELLRLHLQEFKSRKC